MTEETTPSSSAEPSSTTRIIGRKAGALFDLGLTPGTLPEEGATTQDEHEIISPGQMVGRYRIMSKLGEGGFGAVWMAEQTGLSKLVAVKLIKPGMDSRQVIQRFEAERHTLALMSHANIASVLDAGTTPQGHPYFVMELVHGVAITKYCDRHKLTLNERLRLFQHVCQAVHHAHQKAILHRDIKPSNILVGKGDTEAVAKVIDFGIAKALSSSPKAGADSATFTGMGTFLGTPPYMSPEQAGAGMDVDTRSDIYALGAVLYELLTGRTHIPLDRFRDASLPQMVSAIQDAEPVRPSLLFQNPPDLEKSARSAEARGTDPQTLGQHLRGDLDWIVLKAIEKDRTRRYESAAALSDDIERHLRDQPVIARPPSRIYVLGKLVRRNRAAVIAALLSVVALVAGSTAAVIGFVQARQALEKAIESERLAKSESKKSRELLGFMIGLFNDFDQGGLTPKLFRELLKTTDKRRQKELLDPNQKEADMQISGLLAKGYSSLDDPASAEILYLHQLTRLRELGLGGTREAAESLFNAVLARHQQAQSMVVDTFLERDKEMLSECLAIQKNLPSPDPGEVARSEALMAALSLRGGKVEEAKSRLEAAAKSIPNFSQNGWVALAMSLIAQKEKRYDEAKNLLGQTRSYFSILNEQLGENSRARLQSEAYLHHLYANFYMASGSLREAENEAIKEWGKREEWLKEIPCATIMRVADIQHRLKRPKEAEQTLSKIVGHPETISSNPPEFEMALRKLVAIGRSHRGVNDPELVVSVTQLARLLLSRADKSLLSGQAEDARSDLEDCTMLIKKHFEAPFPDRNQGYEMHEIRAGLLARQQKDEEAVADLVKADQYVPNLYSLSLRKCLLMLRGKDLAGYQAERTALLRHSLGTGNTAPSVQQDFTQMLPLWRAVLLHPGLTATEVQKVSDSVLRAHIKGQRYEEHLPEGDEETADGAEAVKKQAGDSQADLQYRWQALLRTLAFYRSGQYSDAADYLQFLSESDQVIIKVHRDLLEAMNDHKLKSPGAREKWGKAVKQFEAEYARFENTDSNPPLEDHLSARLLRDEGQALFDKDQGNKR